MASLLSPDLSKNRGELHVSDIAVNANFNLTKHTTYLGTAGAGALRALYPLWR